MQSENLLYSILEAKAKILILLDNVLEDPRKHIKNLNQYKQVKKLIKTVNDPSLNNKWSEVSRGIYNYLYDKEYRKRGKVNGRD